MKNELLIGHPHLAGKITWYVHGKWEYTDGRRHYDLQIDHNQIVYKLAGKSKVNIGDDSFDAYGGLIFITSKGHYNRHFFDTDVIGDSIDIFFDTDIELPKSVQIFDARKNPRLRELFLSLHKIHEKKKDGWYYKCSSIFYEILYEVSRLNSDYVPLSRMEQLRPAMEYLMEHCFDFGFNCDILAEKCGMSYTYFKKIFNICYKMSPIKYVAMLRMIRAGELLNSGEFTCAEISEMVGYQSNYYFSRIFKSYYGMTPTEYKKSR